jgi:hypothetical protein
LLAALIALALFGILPQGQTTLAMFSLDSTTFTVQSTQPWQDTGVKVTAGVKVAIRVVAGTWSADAHHTDTRPFTPGSGGPGTCGESDCPLPLDPIGLLVGQVSGHIFPIGNSATISLDRSGELYVMINDAQGGLYDDSGTLSVQIVMPPANRPALQVTPIYPTGGAGIPPGEGVAFAWKPLVNANAYLLHIWIVNPAGTQSIKATSLVTLSTLVYNKTTYRWNTKGYLPGTYDYSLLALNSTGHPVGVWCPPVAVNLYEQ